MGTNAISVLTIDAAGKLAVSGSPAAAGKNPLGLAITPDGKFLYATNQDDNTLSGWSVSATGALAPLSTTSLSPTAAISATGKAPQNPAVHPDGKTLTVACAVDSTLETFSIDPKTGLVTPLAANPNALAPQLPADQSLAMDPSGSFAFSVSLGADALQVYTVDATGALAVSGAPVVLEAGVGCQTTALVAVR